MTNVNVLRRASVPDSEIQKRTGRKPLDSVARARYSRVSRDNDIYISDIVSSPAVQGFQNKSVEYNMVFDDNDLMDTFKDIDDNPLEDIFDETVFNITVTQLVED